MKINLRPSIPRLLSIMAGVFAVSALLYLFHIFLTTDLSYEIVHRYSSEDMPTTYKLSGSWAGQAGSMVLWAAMVLGFWIAEEVRWWRRERAGLVPEEEPEEVQTRKGRKRKGRKTLTAKQMQRKADPPKGWLTFDLVRAIVMLVSFALLVATMALEPFAERTTVFPDGGRGLNPVLRTPLMAIHPPIVFIAYALLTFTFAAAVAYMVRKDEGWVDIARPWGRMAWFTLTLGIGIGALWAYETLGWGGYWAWDPVETSSLIPWIALTGLLHALHSHGRRGDYQYLAPLLAGMALFLVFFATFVTRSGVWASVHSYAGAATGDATERVSAALESSQSLRWLYYTMWSVLLVSVGGSIYRFWRAKEDSELLPEIPEGESVWVWLGRPRVTMLVTVFLLSTSVVLVLFMLLVGVDSSVSPGQYNARVGTFAIPLMAFLVICMGVMFLDRRRAVMMAGASVLAGIVLVLLNPGEMDPPIVWFGAALGAFGMIAVLGQWASYARPPRASMRRIVRRTGSNMIHFGLAMVFMAYCLSNVPALAETQGDTPTEDIAVDHGSYSVVLTQRTWDTDVGVSERGEDWDSFRTDLRLYREGDLMSSSSMEVISSFKHREYGTLTYKEDGLTKRMNGEVVASTLEDGHLLIRFQSLRDPSRSTVVDLFDPANSLDIWPALYADADILEGQVVRVRNDTGTWNGFLLSVDGDRGNVTIQTLAGDTIVMQGDQVTRFYRKAYTGLVMTDVHIDSSLIKDIYITILSVKPTPTGGFEATVMITEVPAMAILWTGMALMSAGVVLRPLEHYGERPKDEGAEPEVSGPKDEAGEDDGDAPAEESEEDES
ncbi:MAG: cytochrome c biogenesis protein CcsA [Thermoplasmata archaeon]|nr:MAG: cytochrome c biogenesis protein CcsA [Thermoplasmata archaeon]